MLRYAYVSVTLAVNVIGHCCCWGGGDGAAGAFFLFLFGFVVVCKNGNFCVHVLCAVCAVVSRENNYRD